MAGTEIERKFLVDGVPEEVAWDAGDALRQGYLALDGDTEVRLRLHGDGAAVLTLKRGGGRVRAEEELEVGAEQAGRLWALTEGRRVEKVRHRAEVGGATVELDVYGGDLDGLVVAEVEFPDEAAAQGWAPPPWVVREVTDDEAYKNRALAVGGRPAA
jgi:CYTH domain-containing protein